MSLAELMAKRVARYSDRREDWQVFGFETQVDPGYGRSQRRYIGASGSIDHQETNAVEPVAFTMSVQTMPVGHKIPVHCAVQTLLSKPRPDRPHYKNQRLLDIQAKTYTA